MHQSFSSRVARFFEAFRTARRTQVAALCWRMGPTGTEFLLITTRRTGRWTPPKGNLMPGKTPSQAAAIEAWEEAGVKGEVSAQPIGRYEYLKFRKEGVWEKMAVDVFTLSVSTMTGDYPEQDERLRGWFDQEKAADLVDEADLKTLILDFAPEGAPPSPRLNIQAG